MKNPWEIQPQNTPNSLRESEQGEVVALVVHSGNASEVMDNEVRQRFREAGIWCCQNDISIVYVCFIFWCEASLVLWFKGVLRFILLSWIGCCKAFLGSPDIFRSLQEGHVQYVAFVGNVILRQQSHYYTCPMKPYSVIYIKRHTKALGISPYVYNRIRL